MGGFFWLVVVYLNYIIMFYCVFCFVLLCLCVWGFFVGREGFAFSSFLLYCLVLILLLFYFCLAGLYFLIILMSFVTVLYIFVWIVKIR